MSAIHCIMHWPCSFHFRYVANESDCAIMQFALMKWCVSTVISESSRTALECALHCVVPENIHTPTTEGISYRTPPPLRIFHFREDAVTPPPPWKFQKLSNTPHTPWKLYSSQQTTNKRPCIYRLVRIWDNVVNVACVRRLKVANYPKYLTLTLLSYVYRSRSKT